MSSHKTVLYAAALAGAVTLTLAGCNGGEEPTETPTSSSSSTASPSGSGSPSASGSGTASPSPSVSVSVPSAARAHTEAGAVEFAKWAVGQADNGYVSGDSTTFQAISDPSCKGCKVVVDGIAKLKASGYHQKGPALVVNYSSAVVKSQDAPAVELYISQSAVPMVHTSGVEADGPKAMKLKMRLELAWTPSGWRVREMTKS